MQAMVYVMGIDIGTYGSKGALVDSGGKLIVSKPVFYRKTVCGRNLVYCRVHSTYVIVGVQINFAACSHNDQFVLLASEFSYC